MSTWAYDIARHHLCTDLPVRWQHVQTVATRADRVARALDAIDAKVLTEAAWLHDVGYSPSVATTGFHPLDGALFLRYATTTSQRVVNLVAFHSSAATEAIAFGIEDRMAAFLDERTITRDLLWYLDMSTGPDGQVVSFEERMAEVRERYPVDHYVIRALDRGMPERVAAVERAMAWLCSVGLDHV